MATEEREQPPAPASERLATDYGRRAPIALLIGIGTVASLLGVALGLLIDWFPIQASAEADEIDTLYDVLLVASVPMFVLVTTVVLYSVYQFKVRPGEELKDGPPIHGNTRLEIIWTLIPALMMLALSTYSYVILKDIEEAPAAERNELNVRVVGEQFTWTFFYKPEGGGKEVASNQLYLPIDRTVNFKIQSKDVLHDFWVPAFRMKLDAVPGITTSYRVTPDRLGSYPVVCAELCGLGHAVMRQSAHVVEPAEFEKWLTERQSGGSKVTGAGGDAEPTDVDGKTLFTSVEPSCGACHTLADAGTSSTTGPNLDETLKGKDAAYVKEAIIDPNAQLAAGFQAGIMPPNYEQTLDPQEIDALVDYLVEVTK